VSEHRQGEIAESSTERRVDRLHRFADDVEGGVRGAPGAPGRNSTGMPRRTISSVIWGTGAVHDDHLVAFLGEPEDASGRVTGDLRRPTLTTRRVTSGTPH